MSRPLPSQAETFKAITDRPHIKWLQDYLGVMHQKYTKNIGRWEVEETVDFRAPMLIRITFSFDYLDETKIEGRFIWDKINDCVIQSSIMVNNMV